MIGAMKLTDVSGTTNSARWTLCTLSRHFKGEQLRKRLTEVVRFRTEWNSEETARFIAQDVERWLLEFERAVTPNWTPRPSDSELFDLRESHRDFRNTALAHSHRYLSLSQPEFKTAKRFVEVVHRVTHSASGVFLKSRVSTEDFIRVCRASAEKFWSLAETEAISSYRADMAKRTKRAAE